MRVALFAQLVTVRANAIKHKMLSTASIAAKGKGESARDFVNTALLK
jgi:hypothetical protein